MKGSAAWVVLGSNCFSASHFIDLLLEDPCNFVVGVSRSPEKSPLYLPYLRHKSPKVLFHQIDMVRQPETLLKLLDDIHPANVVNFAALSEVFVSNERPLDYFNINSTAVVALCSELRKRDYLKKYIHVSSAEVYGPCAKPVPETAPTHPTTAYAASKLAADLYLQTLVERNKFPAMIIRSTNVYGPGQQLFKIIPRAMIYLKTGKPIELHGGGTAIRNFIHIRDVGQGIIQAALKGEPGKVYHFTTEMDDSVGQVVRQICGMMGCDFEKSTISSAGRPNQDSRYWLDDSWTRKTLSWEPRISFNQGLAQVRDWLTSNWSQVEGEPLNYVHKV